MSEFDSPTKRSVGHVVRDILGVVVGAVSFPILVSLGHVMFGQPTWLMVLDVALYVPAGWLAAEVVLRLKNRGA